MNRRKALKNISLGVAGTMLPIDFLKSQSILKMDVNSPVKCIVLGAGNRGNTYANYSKLHPEEMQLVGVAEPIESRRTKFKMVYNIPSTNCFNTWEEVFKKPKFADVIIISTPDQLHFKPYVEAAKMGYHILIEKPMATTIEECNQIIALQKQYGIFVGVCHVLRYTPYFRKMKEIVDSGILGDIISIQHLEPIGYWHMAHSYVRGNWRDSNTSSPIILAKSSHDLDILYWITGKKTVQLSASGSLKHFTQLNAPKNSTLRCTDGCDIEKDCPYSALKIYMDMNKTGWPVSVISDDISFEGRMKALKEGLYGKCVYRCDNNQPDNMIINMVSENNITTSFTMSAFTKSIGDRETKIFGTMGELNGNMHKIELFNFRNAISETIDTNAGSVTAGSGHGGGDSGLVKDFLVAVSKKDASYIISAPEDSLESHILALKAEESRLTGKTILM